MSQARRDRREAQRVAAKNGKPPSPTVTLANPVSDHFPAFIIGNAFAWEAMAHDHLQHMNRAVAEELEPYWGLAALVESSFTDQAAFDSWQRFRRAIDELDERFVVKVDSGKGKHVVICGAGPSLAEEATEWVPQGDEVWGCNSALPWLVDNGYKPTHGFTVDQTTDMLVEWQDVADVEYMLATTVHPHLTQYLTTNKRRIRWFHNFVGIKRNPVAWPDANGVVQQFPYEDWMYMTLYPGTVRAGSGLNTVTRAIDVALCMGFDKITVLGADCAMRSKGPMPSSLVFGSAAHHKWLRENTVMHADGGHALASNSTALTFGALIDSGTEDDTIRPGHGRWWESKIDLLISARWLLVMERTYPQINIVGDTYVKAIRPKNRAFLERLPQLSDSNGKAIPINLGPEADTPEEVDAFA
jgi:hypothetical protein